LFHSIKSLTEALPIVYAIANFCSIATKARQLILEASTVEEKFLLLNSALRRELESVSVEQAVADKVKAQIGRSQREFYLSEQLKAIESELGVARSDEGDELSELREAVAKSEMPDEARARAERELGRMTRMAPLSPEASIARTYVECLVDLPWTGETRDRIDLKAASAILEEDHFGLEKVKDRIIEYLAVRKLAPKAHGPVLCFVGPPGVGKTSLARSIARCIGRNFIRISLGGVRDEAEIRGHRRTYVGAMPGKIVQSMKKAAVMNPVFLLDEIDKMSSDFRGDPAAALLEVLDPEQNGTFVDHYLEVDYDLSNVLFITTANNAAEIPAPLLDRMELIRIAGYTEFEKFEIAKRYLIPRAVKNNGIPASKFKFRKDALRFLIDRYTREAGVRGLEREIDAVARKIARKIVTSTRKAKPARAAVLTPDNLRELLGPEPFAADSYKGLPQVGNALGLAWTEAGGEILHVEARTMPGKGELLLTGKLGDVMKESARTALSYIRSRAAEFQIDPDFHRTVDIHIHLPEGATPKDGPSAGITLATSLISAISGVPVRQDTAMTGEVTLRGRVLRIGGLKEKAIAAWRHGIRRIVIPRENVRDLEDIPAEIRSKIKFFPVDELIDVLKVAMAPKPESKPGSRRTRPSAETPRA